MIYNQDAIIVIARDPNRDDPNYGDTCHVGSSHSTSAKVIGTNACLGRLVEQRLLLNCSAVLAESSNFGELPRGREKRWGLDSFCYRLAR